MNHTTSDHTFRSTPPNKALNTTQMRSLRKELLILRSNMERIELTQAATDLRQTVTHFHWLKSLLPRFSSAPAGKVTKAVTANLGVLINQYPLLSSIVSVLLAKPIRSLLKSGAKPIFKWGPLGFAAWEIYRSWKATKHKQRSLASTIRSINS